MKIEDLQLLINSSSDKNIKFKLLNDFITEVTDINWQNIISLFKKFDHSDRIFILDLCIACMNMHYIDGKKYITYEQFTSIFDNICHRLMN